MKLRNRKLTAAADEPNVAPEPNHHPPPEPFSATVKKTVDDDDNNPHEPFDSSMALTVFALLIALFFMGIFSVYLHRIAANQSSSRRHHRRRMTTSPVHPLNRRMSGGTKGVDASTVRSLPVYYYHDGAAKNWINECTVCLGEFVEGEEVKMIPYCGHVFHPCCIEKWLSAHVSCPLCRTTSFFPEEGRLTVEVEVGDTWRSGVRRTSSCSSLGERVSLQRTTSF